MATIRPLSETDECPECGRTSLSWSLGKRLGDHAPLDGQLRMHDVVPQLVLGCDSCSATARVIEDDAEIRDGVTSAAYDRGYEAARYEFDDD